MKKTKENDASVIDFIEQVENPRRRADAYTLLDIYAKTTGLPGKMCGTSVIGFGSYHFIFLKSDTLMEILKDKYQLSALRLRMSDELSGE